MKHLLPAKTDVREMLAMLFGDELVVSSSESDVTTSYAAVYVDSNDNPGAIISCDAFFAANAGAALSMLPPDAAAEAASDYELPQTIRENLYEVMNICTRLLIGESTPHLRLERLCKLADTDADEAIRDTATSSSFSVDIPRYGSGNLSFLVT